LGLKIKNGISMPPFQPSLRNSLLTGASALALSVSSSGAHAQASQPTQGTQQALPQTLTVWAEAARFWTGGGNYNIPALPGLGAPYTSFNGQNGYEGAIGADYRWQGQPWHFIFDFRYGRTGTASSSSSSASSSSSSSFVPGPFASFFPSLPIGTQTNQTTSNSSASRSSKWESHVAADIMIGRDLGLGSNSQLQFGFRIADLRAAAQAQQNSQSTTTTNTTTTFYSTVFSGGVGTTATSTSNSSSSTFARWNSHFFGVGPRVAVTGGIPIVGSWSFDYSGGVAGLIGDRTFDVASWTNGLSGFNASYGHTVFVFNADGFAALSYTFTPNFKASAGVRADYYNSALKTYDINTGGLASIDRIFWGPFVRLTGSFHP
jgi:hypothetical protein